MQRFRESKKRKSALSLLVALSLVFSLASCASTGPKISKEDRRRVEEEFETKFLRASTGWLNRVYRVAYQLLRSPVPGYAGKKPKYGFVGVGVDDLKEYARKTNNIDKDIRGILVRGVYPGSEAEGVDVKAGDVIIALDGKKIKSLGRYFKVIRSTKKKTLTAEILREGQTLEREFPVEKVYYNAQFFLEPTPNVDANAAYSKVQVGIGAIRYCQNDDELATIMGHELAHVTLKHVIKKTGINIATDTMFGVAASVLNYFTFSMLGSLMVYPAHEATNAAISRRYEREADYFGMQHAFHAGYDVGHGAGVFSRLATDEPGYSLLAYTFSTHPKWPERYLRLQKITEELEKLFPEQAKTIQQKPDWGISVPVKPGETIHEALERLSQMETPDAASAPAAA